MFITIISEGFRYVRDHDQTQSEVEQETLVFMLRRFQRWLGQFIINCICARPFHSGFSERREPVPVREIGPVERFPEKVDQLLDALHRVILKIAGSPLNCFAVFSV